MSRTANDYYPTPAALTQALLSHASCIPLRGLIFEPCAGSGDMANTLCAHSPALKVVTNELYRYPKYRPDYQLSATDSNSWDKVAINEGTIDWTITNPPFMEAAKILGIALTKSRGGVAMLLRLSFLEPCSDRADLLQSYADRLRYLIPVNPRPAFRAGKGTDSTTVAWFVWSHNWSWEQRGISCPFIFDNRWRRP